MNKGLNCSECRATVAICSYNGANRIRAVVEALVAQTLPADLWELLVIDNASTDGTEKIAESILDEKFGVGGRVVREERQGLAFARARAAQEAKGEIICFLDDDNIPGPDFVKNAIQAFKEHPQAGSLGGKVMPTWESTPNALAIAVQDFALAICNRGEKAFRYENKNGPVGAGLCIRTEVLRKIYQDGKIAASVVGRGANGYGGGEDLALAVLTWRSGFECWYEPALVLEHRLPARRMEKSYLLELYENTGRGQASVRRISDWRARTPLAWLIGFKDLCRWLAGKWRGPAQALRRQYPDLAHDLHELNQRMTLGRACRAFCWPN